MENIELCYGKLATFTDKELTTKELNTMGISDHFIKRLVEKGKLERIKRGIYLVKSLNRGKSKEQYINLHFFSMDVENGRFDKAYYDLLNAYNNRINNESDTLIHLSLIMLKEILGSRYNFNSLEDMGAIVLEKQKKYTHWNNFCTSIEDGNFTEARLHLDKWMKLLEKQNGRSSSLTHHMDILLNKVLSIQKDRLVFQYAVVDITSLVEQGKYEEATNNYEATINKIEDEQIKENYQLLIDLLKAIVEAYKGHFTVCEDNTIHGGRKDKQLSLYLHHKNYDQALKIIDSLCSKEPTAYHKLLKKLLSDYQNARYQNASKGALVDPIKSSQHFKRFLAIYNIRNLVPAMEELENCLKFADPTEETTIYNEQILRMFKKLIRMQTEGEVLQEKSVEYNFKNGALNNFNLAVQTEDYKKAITYMHIVKMGHSVIFNIKKELLQEMGRLNKINHQKQGPTPEVVSETKAILQEKESVSTSSSNLDYDTLYNLIYNRQYDQALALINHRNNKTNSERLYNMVNRLLTKLGEMPNYDDFNLHEKTELTGDPYKDFYNAISNHDYACAYELSEKLISIVHDPKEFKLYRLLLEDLVNLQDELAKKAELLPELEDISMKIRSMSSKWNITTEDILKLIDFLNRKIEIARVINIPFDRDASLLNIAELTILSLEGKLNNTDFKKVKYQNMDTPEQIFKLALSEGDYITAYEIISNITSKSLLTRYRLAIKMLNIMHDNMRIVSDCTKEKEKMASIKLSEEDEAKIEHLAIGLLTDEEKKDIFVVNSLDEMRSLIKSRHYEEAFKKYLNGDFPSFSENAPDILGNLAFILSSLKAHANSLYEEYEQALEQNDPNSLEYLEEYKKFIIDNYLEDSKSHPTKKLNP